jgi:hypothetical protein
LRTEHETSQVDAVLDGELDEFIESYLSKSAEPDGLKTPTGAALE